MPAAHVQNAVTTTGTLTLPGATTPGNFLACVIATRAVAVSAGPTSTHGTWYLAVARKHPSDNVIVELWYCKNISGTSTTITVPTPSANDVAIAAEYSGVGIEPIDQTSFNNGNSANPSTGMTVTTQKGAELWIGALNMSKGGVTYNTPTNSFTLRNQVTAGGGPGSSAALLDRVVAATGTAFTGANTSPTSDTWVGVIGTFYAKETETIATTIAGTSTALAVGHRRRNLVCPIPSTSVVTAAMLAVRFMNATIVGSSAVTVDLHRIIRLTGSIPAASTVDAVAHRIRELQGLVSAEASIDFGLHRSRPLGVVIPTVSGSTFIADIVLPGMYITSVSPTEVEAISGEAVILFGLFPIGELLRVYVGPTGTPQDHKAYSGILGNDYYFEAKRSDLLKIFMPALFPGTYRIHIESLTGSFTLVDAIVVRPKQLRTSVFSLRRVLPPRWKVGPRNPEGTS